MIYAGPPVRREWEARVACFRVGRAAPVRGLVQADAPRGPPALGFGAGSGRPGPEAGGPGPGVGAGMIRTQRGGRPRGRLPRPSPRFFPRVAMSITSSFMNRLII